MLDGRLIPALLVGKAAILLTKATGSGGTAAPGWAALKIEPGLITKLTSRLEKNIIVTGTNGKTTTSRLIAAILKQAGIGVIHNRTGSNLLRGIASALVSKAALAGKLSSNCWGLWETDEAVFPLACRQIKPQFVLINNLFRDQLDRYGEIDTLASRWREALLNLPSTTTVILNADDATVASLGKNLKAAVVYFGLNNKSLGGAEPDHASDATLCPYCYSSLKYRDCFVGHMGIYSCPKCGSIQPEKKIVLKKKWLKLLTGLPGTYNFYNLTAAVALSSVLNIKESTIIKGLSNFKPAFGRVEKIKIGKKTLNIFLVKNPAGFNEVINTLVSNYHATVRGNYCCLIVINDLTADGTDVSWLWDVHFEKLTPQLQLAIVSGTRAYDMALRLKYTNKFSIFNPPAGEASFQFSIQPKLKKAVKQLLTIRQLADEQLYILPTYTAMLEIRKILNQMGLVHSSWED